MKESMCVKKAKWLLLLLLVFSSSQIFAVKCGDANDDNAVDIVDALLIAKAYVGDGNLSLSAGDVDNNNQIDIVDALLVAQFYVGILSELTGCNDNGPTKEPINDQTVEPGNGNISINDKVSGWASMSGGTTGGGTDLSIAKTVSTSGELRSAMGGSGNKIILVKPGTYSGSLSPGSNTTIIGTAPGVTIQGKMSFSGSGRNNIIIRNIAIRGTKCGGMTECRRGPDAVYIGKGAHHIWFDHCDIADGQDGNFDVTLGGDFITASWTKFHYTYDKAHRFSNLIAGKDGETSSRGKLKITFMYCWWGDRVQERSPRGRFGQVHCFNNYYSTQENGPRDYLVGPGKEMRLIVENSHFDVAEGIPTVKVWGKPTGYKLVGNIGNSLEMNQEFGTVFTIPYEYSLIPASQVKAVVSAKIGGAGNTCTLK